MTKEVPAALLRLWGITEPSRLGRPAELDVGRVVGAAVELADRDGLSGVTLPKVAKALGFTSMSLYRYVGSKDELLVLMADAAIGSPPDLDGMPWREGLRTWAHAEREVHRRRPWLCRVPVSGPPAGPNHIAWMDAALVAMRGTGLDWGAKVGVMSLVGGYVRQSATLSRELAAGRERGLDQAGAERSYGRALAALVTADRFPEAAKLFASTVFEQGGGPDGDFAFGLEAILDGVAVAVRRAGAAGAQR
ncbi:TetR/AcrR family transcriptional regulator [Pseudonocardia acaciae]|uniref:TetR/AcrR family transcriptional regulator n=1 Tax=Pseudonocardia acaciae TaxID=551276 RepID=UPI000B0A8106|nr:TetR/AcrR family transcriptional regulator [Pseudonocardia acaciae]